jgi:hypothetical protein
MGTCEGICCPCLEIVPKPGKIVSKASVSTSRVVFLSILLHFRAKIFDAFNDAFNEFFLLSPKPDFEPKG